MGAQGVACVVGLMGAVEVELGKKIILIVITFDFFLFLEYENTFLAQ